MRLNTSTTLSSPSPHRSPATRSSEVLSAAAASASVHRRSFDARSNSGKATVAVPGLAVVPDEIPLDELERAVLEERPEEARSFMDEGGGEIIYKSLSGGAIGFEQGRPRAVHTTVFSEFDDEQLDAIRTTPCPFQARVDKEVELRVTVVGTRAFTAAIDSSGSELARIDFRRDYDALRYGVEELPEQVREACLTMVQEFGLVYAALDLIRTPDGRYVFLELNPNGQWSWIQAETGLDIRGALADRLAAGA